MEPESSLLYSQAPATCPYPEPTPSSPHFLKSHHNDNGINARLISQSICHYALQNVSPPESHPHEEINTHKTDLSYEQAVGRPR